MAREIKEMIFIAKEVYKKTLVVEASTWTDFARYLCTLKKRRYTKPSLYWMNMDTGKRERISYTDLYNYLVKYSGNKTLTSRFKKLFYV